jgi:hypothetical protein
MKHFTPPIIAKTIAITGFLALPVLAIAPAQAAVMTFESLAVNDNSFHLQGTTYTESGFTVSSLSGVGFLSVGTLRSSYAGSTALQEFQSTALTRLTQVGGGNFDLSSIDLADFTNGGSQPIVNFTGTRADNSTVTQSVTLDALPGLQTLNFSGFTNLAKVEWNNTGSFSHQFDNINVSAASTGTTSVPEPFTIIGTVIGGTAAVRMRKKLKQAGK